MNVRRPGVFILCGVFFACVGLALFLWDRIFLPFHNPLQVVGYCTRIQYNPQNDLVRFLVLIFLPTTVLASLFGFGGKTLRDLLFPVRAEAWAPERSSGGPSLRPWSATLLLLAYAVLIAINVPTYHAFGRFDSYHEGESLGPGFCYLAGERPFRDFVFFHGLIQDPLRSAWAFQLFGKSIAAERAFASLCKVLAWVCLALFLDRLFKKKTAWVAAFLSFLALGSVSFSFLAFGTFLLPDLSPASIAAHFQENRPFWEGFNLLILTPRALVTFFFLLVFIRLKGVFSDGKGGRGPGFWALTFLFSAAPLAAWGYSVDSGLYLTVAYAALMPVFYFLYVRQKPWKGKWLFCSGLGMGAAFLALETISRGGFGEELRLVLLVFPGYKGLSESMPVPVHQWKFLFFFTLLAALTYRFVWMVFQKRHAARRKPWAGPFLEENLVEAVLLLLAGFHFLNVLLRGDEEHLIYSLGVLYILLFYVLARLVRIPTYLAHLKLQRVCIGLAVVIAFFCLARDFRMDVLKANFPLGTPDEAFVSPKDQETIRFLKGRMGPSDSFFTLTSEASWYYFLGMPCPTRFPYIWLAPPQPFQEEIVRDLESKRVKWVLYRDDDWSYRMDGIPNDEKFPIVAQFIRESYKPYRTIEGNEIWILKEGD